MTSPNALIPSSHPDLERGVRRIRGRRRTPEAGPADQAGRDSTATRRTESQDRRDATPQAGGVGQARILRRWSVTDLIARAGGAPRAFA